MESMPNEENGKSKSTGGASDRDSNTPSLGFDLRLRSDSDFVANLGQDIRTYALTLQQQTDALADESSNKKFIPKEAEFFLKERHEGARERLVLDTNARFVFPHVPDTRNGTDVALFQDTVLGINANWQGEVYQANLTQAFKDGQNANLAATYNPNGFLVYAGGTWNPPNQEDPDGNLTRFTGDIQVESPHREEGISKLEIKFGAAGDRPKAMKGDAGENGWTFRFVSGPAFRSDGVSGIVDATLRSNETTTSSAGILPERERRSCEFNLTCIIAQHGADYASELKGSLTLERERTRFLPENTAHAPHAPGQETSKILDAFRMEILTDVDDRFRIEMGYQRISESGNGDGKKELRLKGYFDHNEEKNDYGFFIEAKLPWWGPTAYHWTPDAQSRKSDFKEPVKENPGMETGLASIEAQDVFKDLRLDRYLSAINASNSALADELANEFLQSTEGQRMAQRGDRLTAQAQAQNPPLEPVQTLRGPVMRI